jgi:hypothetical protein
VGNLVCHHKGRAQIVERVFWRTFGPKREEVMDGSWRTMHIDELHDLYSSLIKPYQNYG